MTEGNHSNSHVKTSSKILYINSICWVTHLCTVLAANTHCRFH